MVVLERLKKIREWSVQKGAQRRAIEVGGEGGEGRGSREKGG